MWSEFHLLFKACIWKPNYMWCIEHIFFSTVDSILWVSHCESKQIIMILWVCWFHVLHVLFQKWRKKTCVFHIQPSDWSLYYIKKFVVLNIFFWRLFFCKIPIWMFLVQCYLPNTKEFWTHIYSEMISRGLLQQWILV